MLLCLNVDNMHILAGVFDQQKLIARFRYATHLIGTADQFGIFLINILTAKKVAPTYITHVAIASVVPSYDFTIQHAFLLYFKAQVFELRAGVKTGLNIKYKIPGEVGADRIANAIGAINAFPNQNIIVINMGSATTICAINSKRDYLGGSILPGMQIAMKSLKLNTAKLIEVDLNIPYSYIGQSTKTSIQNGIYFGQLGAIKEIIQGIKNEIFKNQSTIVIGTGGFLKLYQQHALFDVVLSDLCLEGLQKAHQYAS